MMYIFFLPNEAMVQLLMRHYYFFFAIFQKYYIKQKLRRIKSKRQDGVDPIKTAFDKMKVKT